jgi:signal transduction histidine kinase
MRRHVLKLATAMLAATLCPLAAFAAGEVQTKDDAVAFVKKAVDYVKRNGKDKALAEFSNPQGQFVDRELYIVVVDLTGTVLASGANAKLAGKNLIDIKDSNGKAFVREEIEVAKTKGKGWVEFIWLNPVSKKLEPRSLYLEKVDDYLVASGVFNAK